MKITIVGGGMAGLSCGYLLTQLGEDLEIEILESSKEVGGRCKSVLLTDSNGDSRGDSREDSQAKIKVDNCPHIIFQAQVYQMIQELGIENNFYQLKNGFEFIQNGESFAYNPAQNKLWGMTHKNFKLGLADYKGIFQLLISSKNKTVRQIFSSSKMYDKFWYPLCLAIMNDKPENSSAEVFYNTFKYLLKGGLSSLNIYKPAKNWSDDFFSPLCEYLRKKNVNIKTNAKINDISTLNSDYVILATPVNQTLKLLNKTEGDKILHNPITSIHYQLDKNYLESDLNKYQGLTHIYNTDNNLDNDFWFTINDHIISTVHSSFANVNVEYFKNILRKELHITDESVFLDSTKIVNKRATLNHSKNNLETIFNILKSAEKDNILICGDWSSIPMPTTIESSFVSAKRIQNKIRAVINGH